MGAGYERIRGLARLNLPPTRAHTPGATLTKFEGGGLGHSNSPVASSPFSLHPPNNICRIRSGRVLSSYATD